MRELGTAINDALRIAAEGVPGPVFVECAVDLLYDESLIRQWYADAAGKGSSIGDRLLRWYLNRHAARMFEGAADAGTPEVIAVAPPAVPESSIGSAAVALARAERPLIVMGEPGVAGCRPCEVDRGRSDENRCPGLPFGYGARAAGAEPSAADAPRAAQRAARSRLRAAGRRAVRFPPRLRAPCAAIGDADCGQPQRHGCAAQPATRHRADR